MKNPAERDTLPGYLRDLDRRLRHVEQRPVRLMAGGGGTTDCADCDDRFVNVDGDTMTAPLVLPGPPTGPNQAANKQYVDDKFNTLPIFDCEGCDAHNDARYVNTTGDAMTGALTLPADPTNPMQAATKQYVDAHSGGGGGMTFKGKDTWTNISAIPSPANGDLWVLTADDPTAPGWPVGLGGEMGDGLVWDGTQWVNIGPFTGPPGPGLDLYAQDCGATLTETITHNLGNKDVEVYIYRRVAPFDRIDADVEHVSINQVTLRYLVTGEYRVVVVGGEPGTTSGGACTDCAYTHVQGAAAATWDITHGLGFFPAVTVVDSALSVVEGDISYLGPNSVRLTFSGAFAGTAYFS